MPKSNTPKFFNPNAVSPVTAGIFGLPYSLKEAQVALLPIGWDVTASYRGGSWMGPQSILTASPQLDLFDEEIENAWRIPIAMDKIDEGWLKKGKKYRKKALKIIDYLEKGGALRKNSEIQSLLEEINVASSTLHDWVQSKTGKWLDQGKQVGLIGGDHSTPLGLMRAIAKRNSEFGILQIDAHADLREAYCGFDYSHASIMYNALKLKEVTKLVQVGLRDYCEEESRRIAESEGRVQAFTSRMLAEARFKGTSWHSSCTEIVDSLPENVYISFDIDGLDPGLCPNTGTPVPGGLQFEEACYLIKNIVDSGKTIIGFDLVEVAPGEDEWDGNVGARMLYRLCLEMHRSKK